MISYSEGKGKWEIEQGKGAFCGRILDGREAYAEMYCVKGGFTIQIHIG